MRAAMFYGPGDLRLQDIDPQEPGPGEILVDVRAAATCGTDLKSYRRGHPKLFPTLPSRFGHEFAGVVTAVGDGVTDFAPGMRVVAANTAPCGGCWACIRNRESLCENLEFLNGAFAEQVVIPRAIVDRNTYVIPDDLDFEAAAPLEPLATVVHGMAETGIELGDTVVVHGAGPIGLMFVRLATLRGANVISVDQSPWRLEQAQLAGAVQTIDLCDITGPRGARSRPSRPQPPVAAAPTSGSKRWGCRRCGSRPCARLRPGATAVLFGGTPKGAMFSVDSSAMHYEEYTLKGVFHHTPNYVRTAVELLVVQEGRRPSCHRGPPAGGPRDEPGGHGRGPRFEVRLEP